jgi:hypothetical protein
MIRKAGNLISDAYVPDKNSDKNYIINDVIGNKEDFVQVPYLSDSYDSMMAFIKTAYYHVHGASFVYPDKANPITLTSSATPWSETGDIIEVIPADTITKAFDLHWCSVSDISAALYGIVDIFAGAIGEEIKIGSINCSRTVNLSAEGEKRIQVPQQPANTRISARFSDSTSSSRTCAIKLLGHVYSSSLS